MRRFAPLLTFVALASLSACVDHHSGRSAPAPGLSNAPVFETRMVLFTGTDDHADAAVADFTGDGSLDIVVIDLQGDIVLMVGHGNGTFTAVPALSVGGGPIGLRTADVDSDGDQDLVVVRTTANSTDVYLNDGSGTFSQGASLPLGKEGVYLVCADVDGDDIDDIIVSRIISPEIHVFTGDGLGNFTMAKALKMPGGGSPISMVVGDVTDDGLVDLVVSDQIGDRVLVYHGTTSPTDGPLSTVPEEIPVAGQPSAVSIGDLSGDGVPDMAVSAFAAQELLIITEHNGPNIKSFTVPVSGGPSLSTITDLTGDGIVDLLATVQGRYSVSLFPGLPGGGLGPERQFDASGLPLRPMVADFNRDQRDDVLILSGLGDRLNLYLGGEGDLLGAQSFDPGIAGPESVDTADFDGDGTIEVVTAGSVGNEVAFMRYAVDPVTGWRHLHTVHTVDVGRPVINVTAADANGDGAIDVLCAVQGGVKFLRNVSTPGNLAFDLLPPTPNQVFAPGVGPYELVTADMNGDGLLDLVVADFQGSQLIVQRALDANFNYETTPFVLTLPDRPSGLAVADFDGDGRQDVAVARHDIAVVTILTNSGTGELVPVVNLPVGPGPSFLRTADFNLDGRGDLVVSDGAGSSITLLHSTPQGFQSVQFPAGNRPSALLTRDMNGDGWPDILVASKIGADFRVLLGDGRGGFPTLVVYPGTTLAVSAALADLDGDDRDDLVLASLQTTRVTLVHSIANDQ